MNCIRCNKPLEANARFCRNCGLPVTNPASTPEPRVPEGTGSSGNASPSPFYQPVSSNTDAPTVPPTPWQAPSNTPRQQPLYLPGQQGQPAPPAQPVQQWPQQQQQQQAWRPAPPQSSSFAQPDKLNDGAGTMRSGLPGQAQKRRKRRGRGLLIGLAIVIVLLLVLLIGGRFVLNAYAINQINQTFSDAINTIPSAVAILPERDQTITEGQVNTLISLKSSAFSPVQNLTVHFTPNDVEVDFNVFSFSSTITTVPKIVNGELVATNVTIQGLAGLILSPDDITNLMNTQFRNLETHIQHTITAVTLENQAIVLHLKRDSSLPTRPTTLPTNVPTTLPTGLPTLPSVP